MSQQTAYTHRVALMVATQVIMDVEAGNSIDEIYDATLKAFKNGEGNQEVGLENIPYAVRILPWREEGQDQPEGWINWPDPVDKIIPMKDIHNLLA